MIDASTTQEVPNQDTTTDFQQLASEPDKDKMTDSSTTQEVPDEPSISMAATTSTPTKKGNHCCYQYEQILHVRLRLPPLTERCQW